MGSASVLEDAVDGAETFIGHSFRLLALRHEAVLLVLPCHCGVVLLLLQCCRVNPRHKVFGLRDCLHSYLMKPLDGLFKVMHVVCTLTDARALGGG